jgi:hypothetical protein
MREMMSAFAAAACAVFLCGPVVAQGAKPTEPNPPAVSFTLDLAATADQDITLTVPTPTTIPLKIIRGGGDLTGTITLDASPLVSDQGVWKSATLSVDGAADSGKNHLEAVAFAKPVLAVDLHVPELPPGGRYTSRLILTPPGNRAPLVWRFILTSAGELRPATLVLDQNVMLLSTEQFCPWPFVCAAPVAIANVRDKSGNWPLDGVSARLEPGLKFVGPGFPLKDHVQVKFNGKDAPDFFATPPEQPRNVAPRGQATIQFTFSDLTAGEYTIPLRVTAKNSADDDLQRLTVTLQVRHHWMCAVLVLVVAALFSFLATRVVSGLRQRAQFLTRVSAMRPAWLKSESAILPVTWLRATLSQAEKLSERYWLSGPNEIDARLTGAAGMLAVLDRVWQLRERIEAIPDPKVKQRAIWNLDKVIERIPAVPLAEEDVARFKADLATFDVWCDPDSAKREAAFWADLFGAIRTLHAEVQVTQLPPGGARDLADYLLQLLVAEAIQNTPPDLQKKGAVLEVYERLSLLWEVRSHDDWVDQIVDLHPKTGGQWDRSAWAPIDKVYKVVDDGWWQYLIDLAPDQRKVEAPTSTLDPVEAYGTVVFKLTAEAEPGLMRSYLVQKKLEYQWTIDVLPRRSRQTTTPKTLNVGSSQPRVAQYSPTAGQMKASVRITYEGREGPTVQQKTAVPVNKSRDFGILGIFEKADLIAFFVALAASVISGVAVYALTPTFGSLKDYIALFTWGAGIDQGKNFIQSLAAYSANTAAPAARDPAAGAKAA